MNVYSRTAVENLKETIAKGKEAEKQLTNLRNSCSHTWGKSIYDPVVNGGYTIPGDKPGTMGVDFRGPQYVPRSETPRWSRTCTVCDKVEFTFESVITKTEPKF